MIKQPFYRVLGLYLGLFAFMMVALPKLVGIGVVLLVGLVSYGVIRKELKFKLLDLSMLLLALFGAYGIGTFFTHHLNDALHAIEYKLSLLIFPIALSFKPVKGQLEIRFPIVGLILGSSIIGLLGIINAALCYSDSGNFSCFLTSGISPYHHPTYFMAMLIVSTAAAWYGFRNKWKNFSLWWIVPFTLLVLILHFFSLSLAGILFLFIAIAAAVLVLIYRKWGRMMGLLTLVILPALGYVLVTKVPYIEGEWNGAKWYAEQYFQHPKRFVESREFPMSGSEERLILWTIAWQALVENPIGVGTGNVDETMAEYLREHRQPEQAEKGLNPHNQFLQTGIEIGMAGLAILMLIILVGLKEGIRTRNVLLLILVSNLAFNCLFESMLQRQSGIVFYVFWMILLTNYSMDFMKSKNH